MKSVYRQSIFAFASIFLFLIFSVPAAKVWAQAPTISGFNPTSGNPGTLVTITGTNLGTPTAFTIGGTAAIVVSNTGTTLVGMVMPGSATGLISVTNGSGTGSGTGNFTITTTPFPSGQQGSKLVGTGATGAALQGISVAMSADGNTAIVGGYSDNSNVGAVWIYTRSGGSWTQQGTKLVGTGNTGASQQGSSVALSADGNTALVGGRGDNTSAGAAWVFTRSGTTWSQQGTKLVGTGAVGAAQQGFSVSLSADGNTAMVGGLGDNSNAGAAWVYTRSGTTWTQQGAKLVGTGAVGAAYQGWSVALSANGTTAMVGASQDNAQAGAAWVYTRSGTTWTQQGAKLVGTGAVGAAQQGMSVSLSADGNTGSVGGYGDNSAVGAAWVYTRSGTTWTQQGTKLVGTGAVGASTQGVSVSLSADGNTAFIGGYNDNSFAGANWVFTRSGSTWTQQGSKLIGTSAVGTAARQGAWVAMSADGRTAISGAFGDNANAGAAWVYAGSNTITYDGNTNTGGTVPAVTTGAYASAVTLATNSGSLVKTGYTFAGWNTLATGTGTSYAAGASYTLAGDVTLYAKWTANNYTITFNGNGSTAGTMANQTIAADASANLTANAFTRTGFTFIGWGTTTTSGVAYDNLAGYTMGAANVTIYAQWAANNTITFNGNGSTAGTMAAQTIASGFSANLTANAFTRTGFTFIGWGTTTTGGVVYDNSESYTMGASSVTLYAQWTSNFTVIFNGNGSTAGTMAAQTIGSGLSANLTANAFTRTGFIFIGWGTTTNGGVVYDNSESYTMGNANVTLYAQWLVSYTITFNGNGSTAGTMAAQIIGSGLYAPLTANTFTRTGFTFAGWNTVADGSGFFTWANSDMFYVGLGGNWTLYAQWATNYTVTFNANGGTGTTAAKVIGSGLSATLTANAFTRTGFTFAGWNTAANGSGVAYANLDVYTMGSANVTLYAQWTTNYTVTFNANGGTGTTAAKVIGSGLSAPLTANAFTRTGFSFAGWNTATDGSGVAYANLDTYYMGASNVTLYAQWTPSYTITFNGNGSTAGTMAAQTIGSGLSAPLTANAFTRTGFTFTGWNKVADGSGEAVANLDTYYMDASNVTLYAQWTPRYTITFNANGGTGTMAAQTIGSGLSANLTANAFTRTGYVFAGWGSTPTIGVEYANSDNYNMGVSNVTLYAQWAKTITFHANGGTGTMASQTIVSGIANTLNSNTFTRTGYSVVGWGTSPTSGVVYGNNALYTMGAANVTLYAQWTANNYTITFNANGGTGTMANQTIATDASANLTANAFTRTGYVFAGWGTTTTSGVVYTNGFSYTMGTSNTTLYAQWANVPSAPTGLTATPGINRVSLSFTAPTNNGGSAITNYEYSTDNGTSWTAVSPASTATEIVISGLTNCTAYNTRVRAVNSIGAGAPSTAVLATPRTGVGAGTNWTIRTSAADNLWTRVTYGNGLFVAVAITGTGNRVMTSPDGITWTARTSAADNQWVGVTYGNGLFVAVAQTGTGNRVMTSPDGINWTARTSAADNNWVSITYGNGLFVAGAATGTGNRVMTSPDGITWTIRTSAADNTWNSITYGNGLFVAVAATGTGNRVMTSPDGINWTARTSAADNNWVSITYGNGLFVAVAATGTGNRVMTSPDGITWTIRTSAADNIWTSVSYGNGLFVAVAQSGTGNRVMTSPDGITWTIRNSAADNQWLSVTYGNGLFVAVASSGTGNRVMTSPGFDALVLPEMPVTGSITPSYTSINVAFTAPASVGGSAISNYEYSINGGSSWVTRSPASTASPLTISGLTEATAYQVQLRAVNTQGSGCASSSLNTTTLLYTLSVAYNSQGGSAIANGTTNVGSSIAASPGTPTRAGYTFNGWFVAATGGTAISFPYTHGQTANFTLYAQWITIPDAPTGLTATPGISRVSLSFTAPGNTAITNYQYSTDNGTSWTAVSPASTATEIVISGLSNCTAYNTMVRAVNSLGAGAPTTAVSVTPRTGGGIVGTDWTTRNSAADNSWQSITFGNGLFVAVAQTGTGNRVMTSSDGITWAIQTSAADNIWTSVTYGNGLFVAVANTGTGNRVMTSPDGITWNIQNSAADNNWNSVTYGNGLFVSVANTGTGNRVMTSPDGINWSIRSSAADAPWTSVTHGNGLFVAVATSSVMTSPDGITWTSRTSAWTNIYNSVTYGNGLFVAVASSGTGNRVMTSPDGINWTNQTSAANNQWTSVTYGNGLFVAVAQTGTGNRVMTSPNGINWTIRTSAANNTWRGLTYGNGVFVAVANTGTGNRVMTSSQLLVPDRPVIGSITPSYTSIDVAFTDPASVGGSAISNYEYSINGGSSWVTRSPASTSSPLLITGLTPLTAYPVQLRAVNTQGSGCATSSLNTTTLSSAFTVTYDSQGGSAISNGSTTTGASIATSPGTPTRAGYTFMGWFAAATGGTAISFPYAHGQTANFTLYAQWALNLTITYNSQGGSATANGSTTTGASIAASPGSPTRAGYTFNGWFEAATGGTAISFPYTHGQTADFTLYAQWTANTLTVTYDSQGGSAISNGTTNVGSSIAASPGTPTRAGYTFNGWFAAATGGTAISFPYAHGQTTDFTLYAQWTANTLTVTYDSQGGSAISNGSTETDASIAASPGTPTRAGYTFNGWFAAATGGTAVSFPYAHGQTADFTLFAQWTANTLAVTYDSQLGSAISNGSTATDASIAASPGSPARAGYTFNGWFAAATGGTAISFPYTHGQTADFTLYAQWLLIPPPTITSISPPSGLTVPGATVTITGTNFNTTAANNIVRFGAVQANVSAASSTSLTVTAPVGATYAPVTTLNTALALAATSPIPFLPTFAGKGNLTASDILPNVDFTSGNASLFVAIGDLDGDGKPDLAVANYAANTVSVFRNTSVSGSLTASSFATKVDFATGVFPRSLAIGDLDGDGKPDLAVANDGSTSVSVFRNTSVSGSITASSFAAKVDFTVVGVPWSVAISDLDGDGKPDLAVANQSSNSVSVFRNTSVSGSITASSFAARVDFSTGIFPRSLAIGDLDGDGKPDLAVANNTSNSVSVFLNTSVSGSITASSFAAKVDFTTEPNPEGVGIGDLDGDGKPDLAVANSGSASVSVFRNTSVSGSITASSFAGKVNFATGASPFSVAIGDLDGDGKPDLAVTNNTSTSISVFRNTSVSGSITASSFAAKVDYTTGTNPRSVAIGDLDGDGKPDLAVANRSSSSVSVFRNNPSGLISFNSNGGTGTMANQQISYLASANLTANAFTRTGYTFAGWNTATDGTGTSYADLDSYTMVASNVTLYAQWTGNTLMVTYDSQGGSAISNGSTSSGASIAASPGTPTRVGYTFTGWFAAATGGTSITFPYTHGQTADFTLYAQWTANTLTITYDSQLGSAISNGSTTTGASIAASPGTPTKAGYTFKGWFVAATGGTAISFPYAHGQTADFTLYAQWTINDYTVTFNGNGADGGSMSAQTITYNTTANLTANGFTRTGFGFVGWATSAGGVVLYSDGASYTMGAANVNLYAKWAAIPTITSFTPVSAPSGAVVVISGTNFSNASAVNFGSDAAASFTVLNAFTIQATVAAGASGSVSVTTPGGTASLAGFVYCPVMDTPDVTISSDSGTAICAGTTVVFTAVANNTGGGTVVYSFKVNGSVVQSGSSDTWTSATLTNGKTVTCSISISGGLCLSTTTAESNSLVMAVTPQPTWYLDADNDDYYTGSGTTQCYSPGAGYRSSGLLGGNDCDDADNTIWRTGNFYTDADGDNYTLGAVQSLCYGASTPGGYSASTLGTDCDDADNSKWRTANRYTDADGDGFGTGSLQTVCYGLTIPSGYVTNDTDCDDADISIWRTGNFYTDADGDNYTLGAAQSLCYGASTPAGYSATSLGTDCDDSNPGLTANCTSYTWTGASNGDWNNASNWNSNVVPGAGTDVVIPAGTSNTISTGGTINCHSATIQAGATVSISSGGVWNIGGNLQGAAGAVISGAGKVVLNGSSSQTISGTVSVSNLLIGNNAVQISTGSSLSILPTASNPNALLTLLPASAITNNGNLILRSNSFGTGSIAPVPVGATLAGNITQERLLPTANGWYFVGAPVKSSALTEWSELNARISPKLNASMFEYSESDSSTGEANEVYGWKVPNTLATAINPGNQPKGYRIFLGQSNPTRLASVTGLPFVQDVNKVLSYSPTSGYAGGGWNLISNPYPCAIDWNQVRNDAANSGLSLSNAYYTFNGAAGNYGTFTSLNASTGVGVGGLQENIASSQAFFVKANGAGNLAFKESFKNTAANSASFLRTATNELEFLKFKVQQGSNWDEAGVLFYPSAAEGLDNYDALNLTGSAVDVATVMADGKNAAIEVLPQIGEQRILPLKVQTPANGAASFRFEGMENFPATISMYLKDDFLGSLTDIRQNPEISFEAEAGQVYNRFSLILAGQVFTGAESNLVQKKLSLHPNPASNRVAVYSPAAGELELINALGQKITTQKILSGRNEVNLTGLPKGMYQLRLKGWSVEKLIVE